MATRRRVTGWTRLGRHIRGAFLGGAAIAPTAGRVVASTAPYVVLAVFLFVLLLIVGVLVVVVGLPALFMVSGGNEAAKMIGPGRFGLILIIGIVLFIATPLMAIALKVWWGVSFARATWVRLVTWWAAAGIIFIAIGALPDTQWKVGVAAGMLVFLLASTASTPGFQRLRAIGITIMVIALLGGFAVTWWRSTFPARAETSSAVPIARMTPQPTTILVSIPPRQERILNSASILPGCRVYRVGWPQIESGRVKVFEGNDGVAKCEDFPGNPKDCAVDAMNQVRFMNISTEETRFYYTVICLE